MGEKEIDLGKESEERETEKRGAGVWPINRYNILICIIMYDRVTVYQHTF